MVKIAILIVYVDDIILTGSDKAEIARPERNLTVEFRLKIWGLYSIYWEWKLLDLKMGSLLHKESMF